MNFQCRTRFMKLLQTAIYPNPVVNKCYCVVHCIEPVLQNDAVSNFKEGKSSVNSQRKGLLDTFTENLVERYVFKKELKTHNKVDQICSHVREEHSQTACSSVLSVDTKWDENYVKSYMARSLYYFQTNEMKQFLVRCREERVLPPKSFISVIALKCAQKGEIECIKLIQNLCESLDLQEYESQGHYMPYLAAAIWINGNIEEAQNSFWILYKDNIPLRGKIKFIMNILVHHALSSKGDAALVLVVGFAKRFLEEYNDGSFLTCVWKHCILSKWFCDNKRAHKLLEEISELHEMVAPIIPQLVNEALIQGRMDVAQQLFEVLLKYDKKEQYSLVLRSLFDYSCLQKNERACFAIMESSRELDVSLTPSQIETFLLVFCKNDIQKRLHINSNKWLERPNEYQLQF